MEEVVTYIHMVEGVEICRHMEVVEMGMVEVVTCRHMEEEVKEMEVVVTYIHMVEGVKVMVGVEICR